VPLLLVHGWPETKRIWLRNVEPLAAAGFEVIAPDLRGFGESDLASDGFYDPAAHARDLHSHSTSSPSSTRRTSARASRTTSRQWAGGRSRNPCTSSSRIRCRRWCCSARGPCRRAVVPAQGRGRVSRADRSVRRPGGGALPAVGAGGRVQPGDGVVLSGSDEVGFEDPLIGDLSRCVAGSPRGGTARSSFCAEAQRPAPREPTRRTARLDIPASLI
jgi:alpha/beta hydrolase fold